MGFYPKHLKVRWHKWNMRLIATAALSGATFRTIYVNDSHVLDRPLDMSKDEHRSYARRYGLPEQRWQVLTPLGMWISDTKSGAAAAFLLAHFSQHGIVATSYKDLLR